MAYLSQQGEEKWNQAYQIKTPTVVAGDDCSIIFDKGGNDVVIFQKDGVKGEIHTTLPIEKATVSSQGIVCAVLKDSSSPKIVCYDTAGNILVEHKTSLTGTLLIPRPQISCPRPCGYHTSVGSGQCFAAGYKCCCGACQWQHNGLLPESGIQNRSHQRENPEIGRASCRERV